MKIYCGIGDEAGNSLASQIQATRDLGWKHLEARNVEIPGFPKANLHDIPEPAFEIACEMLASAGVGVYCFASTIGNWAKKIEDPFDITLAELPTSANPLGVKGSGQAGCIAAPQTIINAIVDALAPLGIDHIDMPATPERVWRAIRGAHRRAKVS